MIIMEKEAEEILMNIQTQNQFLQNILMQKQTLQMQLNELSSALEEVEKTEDDVYKAVGPILVKAKKNDVKKELEEAKEDIGLKMKSIEGQEKKLRDMMKETQEKFQKFLPKPEMPKKKK